MTRASAKPGGRKPPTDSAPPRRSYKSDGVDDYDVFLLPVSDYLVMFGLAALAFVVRVFRISQPSSVVFDEVQYVVNLNLLGLLG